jgi:hypothetical protein
MRKGLMAIVMTAAVLALVGPAQATILFSDNFNSPDSINNYFTSNYLGWGSPSIENGALKTVYVSTATIQHNFIDQAIVNAGGFVLDYDAKGFSGSIGIGKNTGNSEGEFGVLWSENSPYASLDPNLLSNKLNILTAFAYPSPNYYYFDRPLSSTGWHHFRITALTNSFAAGASVTVSLEVDGIPVDMSGSQNQDIFTWQQSDLNYFVFGSGSGTGSAGDTAWFDNIVVQTAPVPEPASLLLLGSGLSGVVGVAWRRHRR